MDLQMEGVAMMIATSTSAYLVTFAPVFLLMAGVILAMGVLSYFVFLIRGDTRRENDDEKSVLE